MKLKFNIFIIAVFSAFGFSGCINYTQPYNDYLDACFSTNLNEYSVGQTIYFNNCSSGVDSYSWDFGDGTSSSAANPTHTYLTAGNFNVKLNVYNKSGRSTASKIIYVKGSTDLDVLVMYFGTSDPVSNCDVTLYGSKADWNTFTNPLIKIKTGTSGNVIFSNLETKEYFVDAYRFVNDTTYYANENFNPSSGVLALNQVKYLDIYVEVIYHRPKNGMLNKKYVIRKMNFETKYNSDKIQWRNSVRQRINI